MINEANTSCTLNNSCGDDVYLLSKRIITAHWLPFTVAALVASVGLVCNTLILVVTYCWKPLRTKCQMNLASLAAADMVACMHFISYGFQRLYLHLSNSTEVKTQLACHMQVSVAAFGYFASTQLNIVLSVDRLAAVSIPLRYRHWSLRYILSLNGAVWLWAILDVAWSFAYVTPNRMVAACTYDFATPDIVKAVQVPLGTIVVAVVLCLQVVLLALLWKKLRHARRLHQNVSELMMLLEVKAIKNVLGILALYFACMGGIVILGNLGFEFSDPIEGERWYAWGNVFHAIGASGNFIIYVIMQSEFRQACLAIFCGTLRHTVTPVASLHAVPVHSPRVP